MVRESYFIIPDYQFICGPLTEFDPNSILREINTDLNEVLNYAIQYGITGEFPKLDRFAIQGTIEYISRELNALGYIIEGERALTYVKAVQDVAKAYLLAVSSHPHWFTRFGTWVGARYCANKPGAVEFLVRYEQVKYPEFENPEAIQTMSVGLLSVVELLLGNLAGKML